MHRLGLQTILALLLAAPVLAEWTPAERISEQNTSFGPRMAANGDTLHVVYWTQDTPYYLRSIDNGDNWDEPFCIMDTDTSATGVSPIIRYGSGHLIAVWYNRFRNSDRVNLGFHRSTNGGEWWQDISYVLPSDDPMFQKHTFYIGGGGFISYTAAGPVK